MNWQNWWTGFPKQIRTELATDFNLRELKLARDVWDRFFILDAEYYLPILMNNLYLSRNEQLLLVNFVLFSVREDLISYWEIPQNELIENYFAFCRNHRVYLVQKNMFEFLDFLRKNESQNQLKKVKRVLDSLVADFYTHMRGQGKVRLFKKDYSE